MRLDDIDLTDLDRFDAGFPHDVFAHLRREAPVWFHPPTEHTPDGEGFWVVSRHADSSRPRPTRTRSARTPAPAATARAARSSRTCPAGSPRACSST